MNRKEIIKEGGFANGGTITKTIEELEQSGFITPYYLFGKKNNGVYYRLTDEYSVFYLLNKKTQKEIRKEIPEVISEAEPKCAVFIENEGSNL